MAGETILFSQSVSSGSYIQGKIVWKSSANEVDNSSDVTAEIYIRKGDTRQTLTTPTSGTWSFKLSIDGNSMSGSKFKSVLEDWVLLGTKTVNNIEHGSNGTRSITISGSVTAPSGTSYAGHTTSGSDLVALDTIARASTIDSLSCATRYFDGKFTYKYTPQSASFFNKCTISLYRTEGFKAIKIIYIGRETASQKTATVTLFEDELATLYGELPSTTEGKLRFTLRTYSDSDYSTQIGDADYREITLSIPKNDDTKPKVGMTIAPVSTLEAPFDSLYIQGRTKVDANFSGEGKFGASVTSYKMSVNGNSYGSPYTSGYLLKTGSLTVLGTATDSRGFTNTESETIEVIPYSRPQLLPASDENEVICARCDKDGNLTASGTYLKIKARRSYSKVTANDVQNNFCLLRYRYREESESSFSSWKSLLAKSSTSTDTVDTDPIANVVSSAETAYVVQVGVIDDMGESAYLQFGIPTDFVTIDVPKKRKGKRIGLLRYAKDVSEPGIDVGADMYFNEGAKIHGVYADFVIEKGLYTHEANGTVISGSWRYRKWDSGVYDMSGIFEVQPTGNDAFPDSNNVAFYSEQLQIKLPFAVESIQYTGTPTEQLYWLINAALFNESTIGFRLARFGGINTTSPVNVRLVAHGRWK